MLGLALHPSCCVTQRRDSARIFGCYPVATSHSHQRADCVQCPLCLSVDYACSARSTEIQDAGKALCALQVYVGIAHVVFPRAVPSAPHRETSTPVLRRKRALRNTATAPPPQQGRLARVSTSPGRWPVGACPRRWCAVRRHRAGHRCAGRRWSHGASGARPSARPVAVRWGLAAPAPPVSGPQ